MSSPETRKPQTLSIDFTIGTPPGASAPTVVTERLILRAFTEADLAPYNAILQTPEVRASLMLPESFDEFSAWEQLAAFMGQWTLRGTGQWAVEERSSGRLIGRVGPHHPHRRDWPGVEVGWTFAPDVWGAGYATEAGRATVDWAFSTLDVSQLCSMIRPANERSQAVARRLGFVLVETRPFAWFPSELHGRWELTRKRWAEASPGGATA